MFKYTLCFVKQNNNLLLLNREFAPTKGLWNGVGGKIEENETPLECAVREIFEETGIELLNIQYKGIVTWDVDGSYSRRHVCIFSATTTGICLFDSFKSR